VPFSKRLTGTIATSNPNSAGDVEVRLTLQVQGTDAPLVVQLIGTAVNGGVSMSTSNVTFGNERGAVTALNGSTIAATVRGASDQVDLVLQLSIDQQSGVVSGSVSATSGGRQ
jgi:hypothetical protein